MKRLLNNKWWNTVVFDSKKKLCGHILEIRNFGAGDIIEMSLIDKKDTIFLPFDRTFVTEINLEKNYMIFDFVGAGIWAGL